MKGTADHDGRRGVGPDWEWISGADRGGGAAESRDSGSLIASLGIKASIGSQQSKTYYCVCVEYWSGGGSGRERGAGFYTSVLVLHSFVSPPLLTHSQEILQNLASPGFYSGVNPVTSRKETDVRAL